MNRCFCIVVVHFLGVVLQHHALSSSLGQLKCPANFTMRENTTTCYHFSFERKEVYWKASEYCIRSDSFLVTVKDEDLHNYLAEIAVRFLATNDSQLSSGLFWIGLSDRIFKGEWRWSNCADGVLNATDFQGWASTEVEVPNTNEQRCAALSINTTGNTPKEGVWKKLDCWQPRYFICQTSADYIVPDGNSSESAVTGTETALLQDPATNPTNFASASSPLAAILLVIISLAIVSVFFALWFHKRNRDSQLRRLIHETGMPAIAAEPASRGRLRPQPPISSIERHFSNNSNRHLEAYPGRTVYSGADIDVIEEDALSLATTMESSLSFPYLAYGEVQPMDRFGQSSLTPVA